MAAFSDEYRELLEGAHDAVRALLDASAPESWTSLRAGYGKIRRALSRDVIDREREERREERRLREEIWRMTPPRHRAALLLLALGDEWLTIRELTARANAELVGAHVVGPIYESHVRRLVMRMLRAGELDRAAESSKSNATYRYFRKQPLEGPIAELERTYQDDEEGGAS